MAILTGKDYPELCDACRRIITDMAIALEDFGPDTDNEEAACDYVYDRGWFCGGHECIGQPE